MKITIIGSFRKYYDDICELIKYFGRNGIEVLSPKKSFIVDNIEGFVILNSDSRQQQPFMIQEHVFDNIKKSNLIYVWNPEGYLGNSTCYEIGKIVEMGKPILFKEMPKDLPIKVENGKIRSADQIVELLNSNVVGVINDEESRDNI